MSNKEYRKNKAQRHHEYMSDAYSDEIKRSITQSEIFEGCIARNFMFSNTQLATVEVKPMTSDEAIWYLGGDCCVLNFASFTRPGGGFIKGSMAQEEALCHVSDLYEVLVNFTDKYDDNFRHKTNHGLYQNWAIYSPDIIFIEDENKPTERVITADVITCAAPNKTAATEVENDAYDKCLESRIAFVLDVCEMKRVKKLVLGAFGCGVFGNDPERVADIFMNLLSSGRYSFKHVVFGVPDTPKQNYEAFRNVAKKYGFI